FSRQGRGKILVKFLTLISLGERIRRGPKADPARSKRSLDPIRRSVIRSSCQRRLDYTWLEKAWVSPRTRARKGHRRTRNPASRMYKLPALRDKPTASA